MAGSFLDSLYTRGTDQLPEVAAETAIRTGAFIGIRNSLLRVIKSPNKNPYALVGALGFDIFAGRNLFDPLADAGGAFIRNVFNLAPAIEGVSMETQRTQQLFSETDDDKVNVFVVNGEQRASISSSGTAEQVSTVLVYQVQIQIIHIFSIQS